MKLAGGARREGYRLPMQRLNDPEATQEPNHPRGSSAKTSILFTCAITVTLLQSIFVMLHEPLPPHAKNIAALSKEPIGKTPETLSDVQGSLIGRCFTIADPTTPGRLIAFHIDRDAATKELIVTVNGTTFFCPDGIALLGTVRPSEVIDAIEVTGDTVVVTAGGYGTASIPLETMRKGLLMMHAKSTQKNPAGSTAIDVEAAVTPDETNTLIAGIFHARSMMFGNKLPLSLHFELIPTSEPVAQTNRQKSALAFTPVPR